MGPLEHHVRTLANDGCVTVTWCDSWHDAEAWVELRSVTLPRIHVAADYLMALHELGHVLAPDAEHLETAPGVYGRLVREGAAWAWAASVALPVSLDTWEIVLDLSLVGRFLGPHGIGVPAAASHEGPGDSVPHSGTPLPRTPDPTGD